MHVCLINMPIEYYSPVSGGAISTIMMHTARELLERGHRVSVLTPVNADPVYGIGKVIPVDAKKRDDLHFLQRRVSSLRQRLGRWDWPYFEYYIGSVKRELARMSPAPEAVVLFNDLVSPAHIKNVLPRTRVIVWLQNEWRTRYDMRKTIASTDLFLTCSEYIRQWTAKTHGIPLGQIAVAASGVDSGMFTPRADYLEPGKPLKVLFLGRIDPNKGPDITADAVSTLRAEGLAITLTVAGGLWFYGHGNEMSDPFFRELKTKMDAAGAEYLGHVPRAGVPGVVRQHDVVCVLSRSNEPFGLVALEAMAGGCAVVASNRGGLPEACGDAAILVDPDDFPATVSALRRFATSLEFLREAKEKAVARAARSTWAETAGIVEDAAAGGAVVREEPAAMAAASRR